MSSDSTFVTLTERFWCPCLAPDMAEMSSTRAVLSSDFAIA
jgi:hypothetical protein